MSRFIDRLKQASQSEPQPMGFRKEKSASRPRLLLVAEVKDNVTAGMLEGADAVLLEGTTKKPSLKTGLPVGIRLFGGKAGKLEGIDYVVMALETPIAMVEDEKIGRVMAVAASLEMSLLGTLKDLPLDALFIAGDGIQTQAVTWQYLMLCRRFSTMSDKPLLAAVPPDASRDELQMLWDVGVDGVVAAAKTAAGLKKLRSLIDGLTLPAKRKWLKARGIVPSLGKAVTPVIEEEDEEEE